MGWRVETRLVWPLVVLFVIFVFAIPVARGELIDGIEFTRGPATVPLGGVATLSVPAGYLFTGPPGARRLMEQAGNTPEGESGALLFDVGEESACLTFTYQPMGHVPDDERNVLDSAADQMLASIRESTENDNQLRRAAGRPTLTVIGWDQRPAFDPITHNLTWAIRGRNSSGGEVTNCDSRVLSRKGVMNVKLILSPRYLTATIPTFRNVIGGISFNQGEQYSEFRPGDKTAGYGLTGLVTGGATIALVKSKFWKFLLWIGAGIVALFAAAGKKIREFFGGSSTASQNPVAVTASPSATSPIAVCPQCGQQNRLDGAADGRQALCGQCKHPLPA